MQDKKSGRPLKNQQWRVLGNWEPKMFLLRRGDGTFTDVEKLWQGIHSDKAIERMKELGINFSHIHFHKGYGLEYEADSIKEAVIWAEKLHANGINVGVYIGSTFFTETFKSPDYDRMVMQNDTLGWNGPQYFRKYWCYNSPHSIEYFKKVIKTAVEQVKANLLHIDSAFTFYHDQLCRCEYCQRKFCEFIRDEIGDIIASAGYAKAEQIAAPLCGNLATLAGVTESREPGDIAWQLFHAKSGYRALKSLADYAKSLNPDIFILYNGANLCGITSFSRPHMELEMMKLVDATCIEDENENPAIITDDGMAVSRFRSYKFGSRAQTRVNYYTTTQGSNNRLMLAESAAFNYRSLGFIETAMQVNHRIEEPDDLQTLTYLRDNEELFLDRDLWHHVAVLRHHESMLLNPWPSALSPYVIEQTLFEEHVPFSIIAEDELDSEKLKAEFDLLILPDCKCLSDAQIDEILRYVEMGGQILVIGKTASATPLNQFRSHWPLAKIFGDEPAAIKEEAVYEEIADSKVAGLHEGQQDGILRASFGNGKAVYIPQIDFDLPDRSKTNRFAGFEWYYHLYWKRPHNSGAILEAVEELLGEKQRLQSSLGPQVGIESYTIETGYRLGLVNYLSPEPTAPAEIRLRVDDPDPAKLDIFWHSPENDCTIKSAIEADGCLSISIPAFELLATLTISRKKA